jgi:heme/copper-type cytochrome/quinol oxidase subunit 2
VDVEIESIEDGETPLFIIVIVIGLVVIAAVVISYATYRRNRAKGSP